jgi:predicted AAA+ superfamily ATPase
MRPCFSRRSAKHATPNRDVRPRHWSVLTGAGPSAAIPRDGTFLGALLESLAALSIRTFAQRCDARVSHLRTKGGRHEFDFIVEADSGVIAFEVKLSASISDAHVSHLHWLRAEFGDNCIDVVVLNTGPEAYRRRDGVAVIPLALPHP